MFNWSKIENQLINFLKHELEKTGFKRVVLGLSGGLDSAIVAILCKKAFDENMNCVIMPSQFSNENSLKDAKKLCDKFNISYEIVDISPMITAYLHKMNKDKLRVGNYSARVRMSILYDISSRDKAIVVGTSNKSELLLGYGTIFGDIACAINPIGNIYKSDEFEFGKYLGVIKEILKKKPSADLWENQTDEEELGYTYKQIDDTLKLMIDEKKTKDEIIALGYEEKLIDDLKYRIKINEFKGKLPLIANIKWS